MSLFDTIRSLVIRDHRELADSAIRVSCTSAGGAGSASDMTAKDWMERIKADPENGIREFMDAYPSLPKEVRDDPALQLFMQYKLQEMNRDYSFRSNLNSAMNEISIGLIKGIRV